MYGTIIFKTIEELAEFLAAFGKTHSTCVLEVESLMNGNYRVTHDMSDTTTEYYIRVSHGEDDAQSTIRSAKNQEDAVEQVRNLISRFNGVPVKGKYNTYEFQSKLTGHKFTQTYEVWNRIIVTETHEFEIDISNFLPISNEKE